MSPQISEGAKQHSIFGGAGHGELTSNFQPIALAQTVTPAGAPTGQTPTTQNFNQSYSQPVDPNVAIRGSINSRFDSLIGDLNAAQGRLGASEGKFLGQVQKDFTTNRGILESSKGQGLAQLDRSGEKVQEAKSRTLSELDANIRNAMDTGAIRLGNLGAADSSATGQLGFALTKLQNQNRGNILRDVNQQNLDLDLARTGVETEFNNQFAQLKNLLDSEKLRITEEFGRQRELIEAEKRNASFERQEALDNLTLQLANNAASNIQGIESQANTAASNLAAQAQGRLQTQTGGATQALQSTVNPFVASADQAGQRIATQGNIQGGFNLQGGPAQSFNLFSGPVRRDDSNPLTVSSR